MVARSCPGTFDRLTEEFAALGVHVSAVRIAQPSSAAVLHVVLLRTPRPNHHDLETIAYDERAVGGERVGVVNSMGRQLVGGEGDRPFEYDLELRGGVKVRDVFEPWWKDDHLRPWLFHPL